MSKHPKKAAARRRLPVAPSPSRRSDLVQYNPDKGLKKIANAKAGEERARRARDVDGMGREIIKKMKAQAEYILWRDDAMATLIEARGGGAIGAGPGRGKKLPAQVRLVLPKDDPGQDVADRWRKDFCTKVEREVDGKKKRVTVIDPDKFRKR
jgi:hypothetical protein